eukprot:472204_1
MILFSCNIYYFLFLTIYAKGPTIFTVDLSVKPLPVWNLWESCTTFDHGYLALRYDWREQLLQTHKDLNIQYVRFHNIFDDDIGIVNPKNPSLPYSYVNVDKIYDWIISIGMKPLVELDFMPSTFVSNPEQHIATYYNYPVYGGPPKNHTQWFYFIKDFIQHLVDRYGAENISQWKFDAWNEPNLGNNWQNENLTSFEITWNYTALAVKSVNKSFRIGSPGTTGLGWIPEFPQWCKDNNIPLDWVSTHMYPTKSLAAKTHNGYFQVLQNLSKTIKAIDKNMGIGLTAYGCTTEPKPKNGKPPGEHDTSYNAACFTTFASQFQQLDSKQFELMSFTGFTDLWDQIGAFSNMFHNGLGWLTDRGVKKPTYWALQLLVDYASNRKYYPVIRNNSNEENTTLELFVTINNDKNQIALFVMNWMLLNYPITNETVEINLVKTVGFPNKAIVYRIDDDHCNPLKTWEQMGSPMYPTQKQIDMIANSSTLIGEMINVDSKTNDSVTITLDIPIYGMTVIVFDL